MPAGVSSSGSWPALGEMTQKTKKEAGEKSPPEKVTGVPSPNTFDSSFPSSSSITAPPCSTAGSQEIAFGEKKVGSMEVGVPSGELSELEQQKLAGKKKGSSFVCCVCILSH